MKKLTLLCAFILIVPAQAITDLHHERYHAIKPLLEQFKRKITCAVLDDAPQLPIALAAYHRSITVIISTDPYDALSNACHEHPSLPLMLLKKRLCMDEIIRLGECEHFDVVCAFDVLRQYGATWNRVLKKILALGDYTFIESTCAEHEEQLLSYEGTIVANYDDRKLWLIEKPKIHLTRRSWFFMAPSKRMYEIKSTFSQKQFIKSKGGTTITPWIPGINLQTFKMLNGIYPDHAKVREQIKSLSSISHNDMAIFNIIIQGNKLVPIDCNERGRTKWKRLALWAILKQFPQ